MRGQPYKGSPCEFCDKDSRGRQRENESREIGHGRVTSLELVERYVKENVAAETEEEEVHAANRLMMDFVKRFCTLDIRIQFMFEQRDFFGKSLEDVAAAYRREFGRSITPAGVSAALKAARERMRRTTN